MVAGYLIGGILLGGAAAGALVLLGAGWVWPLVAYSGAGSVGVLFPAWRAGACGDAHEAGSQVSA